MLETPGFVVCHQPNNRVINLSHVSLTDQFSDHLTTGNHKIVTKIQQQVMIVSTFVRLHLMASVTIWPHWFNMVVMVT